MENIRFDALSFYDSILKSYAAENATVFISRKYTNYVSVLKDRLLVKKVIELTGGNTRNWDDITSIQGSGMLPARVGDTYAFRVTYGSNQNPASLTYNGINGESVTTNIHTGNAIVCIAAANEDLETDAKWLAVTDNITEIVVNNNNPTLAWGQQSVVGSVQGTNLSVVMPDNPAQNIVQQATYDSNNILEPISGSDGKKIRIPEIYVLTEDTTDSQNNTIEKGIRARYWDNTGTEHTHLIAGIEDLAELVDLTSQSERIAAIESKIPSEATAQNKLADKAYVTAAIEALPEPMVFKGSLGTGGTITALPVDGSATIGDTYKVITAGTYAGTQADVGDTFICTTKTSSANTWTLIPSGDEPSGTVTSIAIAAISPINVDNAAAITTSGTRTISHATSGVTAGTYRSVTVDNYGHVTAGNTITTVDTIQVNGSAVTNNNGTVNLGNLIQSTSQSSATSPIRTAKTLTQAEYYALTSYDAYTEYIIIPNS